MTDRTPVAWMRRWAFDGETPVKVRKENGRLAWQWKHKLHEVTVHKCLPDDVPLYSAESAGQPSERCQLTAKIGVEVQP